MIEKNKNLSNFMMIYIKKHQVFFYVFCILLGIISLVPTSLYAQIPHDFKLINLRSVGDLDRTRLIAVFNAKPNFQLQLLDKPARLVINLPEVDFSAQNNALVSGGLVSGLRYGVSGPNQSRIIINSIAPFLIENTKLQELDGGLWQLVVDLTKTNQAQFQVMLKKQWDARETKQDYNEMPIPQAFKVVIDAGHGGIDSGAKGVGGVLEKNVTLAFARSLRDELEKNPALTIMLTRDSDVFLRLNERVQKARAFGADLFISIHADTINATAQRGATVYTISDKASDAVSRALAEKENKADLLDGLPADETSDVTDILIDLTQRETHAFSVNFADKIVLNLTQNNIILTKNPHRFAGFMVLKAPDVPSVLIELGYLSNKFDEHLITDPVWRAKMVKTIARSVNQFAQYRNGTIDDKKP